MSKYILIFRADPLAHSRMSSEEMQTMMGEWKKCFEKLKADDVLIDRGAPLTPVAKILSKEGEIDGPLKSGNTFISYYIIVQADNLEKAVQIAKIFPATDEGSIEVRELLSMPF